MTADGLRFDDLGEWQAWEHRRRRVQRRIRDVKGRARRSSLPSAHLYLPADRARTLVVLDVLTPSSRAAAYAPLAQLDPATTAVLINGNDADPLVRAGRHSHPYAGVGDLPAGIGSVLSLGSYRGLSASVATWAKDRDVRFCVVQHGLLTPWSPPLAPGDHLLAWTEQDAAYWTAGRADVTAEVVGSQLLWQAGQQPPVRQQGGRPVLLGQLHGTELPRHQTLRTYVAFARAHDADYRPHPAEADLLSRGLHRVMRRAGVQFEESGRALSALGRPVVSIFSTGTLEAAHQGLPAWVIHPNPPDWVRDFWCRYRLSAWGEEPTAAWHRPAVEPASAVATALQRGR